MEAGHGSYTHQTISDDLLAVELHVALGFGPQEKYRGDLFVQLQFNEEKLAILSRSDAVERTFTIHYYTGETVLEETLFASDRYYKGRQIITTSSPGQGIMQQELDGFSNPKKKLTGKEAQVELGSGLIN